MEIVKKTEKKKVGFSDLDPGDCFEYNGVLYVKSECAQEAVGLEDGNALCNMCGDMVIPVKAKVTIG